jgi:CRISPR-associated endonuclease Csn1
LRLSDGALINLDKNRIEDLGVRIFPPPLNIQRTDPPSQNSAVKPAEHGNATKEKRQNASRRFKPFFRKKKSSLPRNENILNAHSEKSPYELRTDASSRELSAPEWFRALIPHSQTQGFQSNKKIKAGSKEKEKGRRSSP